MYKLDFGCGNGGFPGGGGKPLSERGSWLVQNGGDYTVGFDINPEMLVKTKERVGNGSHFLAADGRMLPFKDETFEFVREWGIMHHIPGHAPALEEIARVMKKGGTFVAFEIIDNEPIYALGRTIAGSWHGDKITDRFNSEDFLEELKDDFVIQNIDYWWRPMILDLPSSFWETYPGWWAGICFQYHISKLFTRVGLMPRLACQMTVTMVKK